MSVATTTAIAIGGIAAAGGGIASGLLGKSSADKASQAQVQSQQAAIDEQRREFDTTQQNFAPFVSAGQTGIGQLMQQIQSGKFGAGSTGTAPGVAPQYAGADYHLPTLDEVRATPGYEFTAEQGDKGILAGAAAAGGAISGGTLKALGQFRTGLADSTYTSRVNESLAALNAGLAQYQTKLQGYGANLAGFQTGLQANNQEFNQEIAPVQIGAGSTANLASAGQASAANIGQLMTGIGNAQASGIVGGTNALTAGLNNGVNSITQSLLLSKLLGKSPVTGGIGAATLPVSEDPLPGYPVPG